MKCGRSYLYFGVRYQNLKINSILAFAHFQRIKMKLKHYIFKVKHKLHSLDNKLIAKNKKNFGG